MRFSISLLTLISIASVIGTVLKQNEPFANYINQFGPFWFEVFRVLGLYSVYNTVWFLTILGFLVLSTSLCITRNAPRMLRDMRSWRDKVREESLSNFGHHGQFVSAHSRDQLTSGMLDLLTRRGFKVKRVEHPESQATLLAAKAGTWNRLGYIFAHGAIVMICIGGLLDSELPIRAQIVFGDKQPIQGNMLIRDVPSTGRLSTRNPTFRANVLVPEGASARHAIVSYRDAALVQDLPFTLELKKFIVEYYSTGMPKLFASEVVVTDHETGESFERTIRVNEPLRYKDIAVYQSSFEDGGSKLDMIAWPMSGTTNYQFQVKGEVGGSTPLTREADPKAPSHIIEFTGFRPINVENVASAEIDDERATRVQTEQRFRDSVASVISSGASATRSTRNQDLRNVGPSVQYKLRDTTGQAREYNNYMLPVEIGGQRFFLAGVRDSPNENFRFLRIPADAADSLAEFIRLRSALANADTRAEAARRFADLSLPPSARSNPEMRAQLMLSAHRALDTFAGTATPTSSGGYNAIAALLERSLGKAEQENAIGIIMRMLSGSLWHLWQVAREQDGLKPVEDSEVNENYLHLAMTALSDSFLYQAPVLLQLDSFTHIQASVFQLTRSPGKNVVYLGCLLLVIGIFAMFYIRERRVWVWVKNEPGTEPTNASRMTLAMSANRQNLDLDKEFAELHAASNALISAPAHNANKMEA